MTAVAGPLLTPALVNDLERAHLRAVHAAAEGMSDYSLGALRLDGTGVPVLADAAVSSATPYLRAPLLARLSAIARLHPTEDASGGLCPECQVAVPCPTAKALQC